MPVAAALVWAGLVFGGWWTAFRFDPADALRAWSLWGLPWSVGDGLLAIRGHLHAGLIALLVLVAVRGAGAPVVRLAGVRTPSVLGALPIGVGVAGAAWLGVGLLGLLRPGPAAWMIQAGFLLAGLRARSRQPRLFPPGMSGLALAAAAGCGLAALPAVLAPEVTYDAMAVHLGAPHRWLAEGRIVRLDAMMFSEFPLAPQMAYMVALALGGGDAAAKWLHWTAGIASLAAAGWLGAALAGRSGANWSVAMLAGVPMIVTQMTRANADLWTVWAAAAGGWWLLRPGSMRSAALAGLCLGAAASAKLTAAIGIGAGAAVLILNSSHIATSLLLICSSLLLLPWLLKSLLLTGNPVYPFLWSFLGGPGWSVAAGAAWAKDMSEANSFNLQYGDPLSRLAAPWSFVMHDRGSAAGLAPFVLALVPLLVLVPYGGRVTPAGRRAVAVAAGWSVLFWLGWFWAARDPRFCLPAWPLFGALAAAGLLAIDGWAGRGLRAMAGLSVAGGIVFAAAAMAGQFAPGPVALGAIPRRVYLARLVAPADLYVPVQSAALAAAGPGGRLLVIGDVKAPAAAGRALYPSMYDPNPLEGWIREAATPGRLRVRLRQRRIEAVFHHESGASYLHDRFGHFEWSPREAAIFTAWMRTGLDPVRVVPVDDGRRTIGAYRVIR